MEEDPQILWRRIGAGDRQAFTALYERHEQDVLRFCQAVLRDADEAREAANSTWAAVWRSRAAAGRDVPLRPWLFRIAHNEAIDVLRARRSHEPLDAAMAGHDDPVADAELHERLATLRDDLLALTEHQRTALVLRELSGLSHEEIASVLDVSVAAAKQTIYEARQALIAAEGGRSLSCDLVRRDISAGDRRVLRARRIRAHLRTCAACRAFADGVDAQRRRFRALLPAPAGVALLARLGAVAEIGGGGGATAAAGLSALGAKAGGIPALTVAVAAIGVGVGGGAVSSAVPEHDGYPAAAGTAVVAAPAVVRRPAPHRVQRTSPTAAPHEAVAARRAKARAAAVRPTAPPGPAKKARRASSALPPGQATRLAPDAGAKTPPGQSRKAASAAAPPGQTRKAAPATAPPGQVKKQQPAPSDPAAQPPGRTKPHPARATAPTTAQVPPGQAKKPAQAHEPSTVPPKPGPAAPAGAPGPVAKPMRSPSK